MARPGTAAALRTREVGWLNASRTRAGHRRGRRTAASPGDGVLAGRGHLLALDVAAQGHPKRGRGIALSCKVVSGLRCRRDCKGATGMRCGERMQEVGGDLRGAGTDSG